MQENNKEITIQDVITKKKEISKRVDTKAIMKAYNYAVQHHGDQKRRSGEPYIIHPINVAYILAGVGLDEATICAALLHDGSRSYKTWKYAIYISRRTKSRRL